MLASNRRLIPIAMMLILSINFAANVLADGPNNQKATSSTNGTSVDTNVPPRTWVNVFWSGKGLRGKSQGTSNPGLIIEKEAGVITVSGFSITEAPGMDIFLSDVGGEYYTPVLGRKIVVQRAWLSETLDSRPVPAPEFVVFEPDDNPEQVRLDFKEYLGRTAKPPTTKDVISVEWKPSHRLASKVRAQQGTAQVQTVSDKPPAVGTSTSTSTPITTAAATSTTGNGHQK